MIITTWKKKKQFENGGFPFRYYRFASGIFIFTHTDPLKLHFCFLCLAFYSQLHQRLEKEVDRINPKKKKRKKELAVKFNLHSFH